ncbi:MAG: DUF3996 domain-containing protein [Spirochaetales bacterium]|nr:DUF3996 domain-containing protein [Spirochaetales bacterium]
MKKKALLIAIAMLIAASTSTFALGLGGGYRFGAGEIGGTSLLGDAFFSVKFDEKSPLLGISGWATSTYGRLGLTADWWFFNNNIKGRWNWYLGAGPYVSTAFSLYSSYLNIGVGARLPIGFNWFFVDNRLELFLEAAPAIGLGIKLDNYSSTDLFCVDWSVLSSIGVRWWIN